MSNPEDHFLVPMMTAKALDPTSRLQTEHADLDQEVKSLRSTLNQTGLSSSGHQAFYLALNRFIARYLGHLDYEETELLPRLQNAFTDAELAVFPRQSIAATSPQDQDMTLGHMFPAMQGSEIRGFFAERRAKAPKEAVQHLEGIARGALGDRAGVIE